MQHRYIVIVDRWDGRIPYVVKATSKKDVERKILEMYEYIGKPKVGISIYCMVDLLVQEMVEYIVELK